MQNLNNYAKMINNKLKTDADNAVKVLRNGGIILYPTDTIWGLGCDATNKDAVRRIYEIKKRDDSKSLIVLVNHESMLYEYVKKVPDIALELARIADRPLTIIYEKAQNLAENLIAEDGSIGIRIVRDEFCMEMIKKFNKPVVSTSANISGRNAPANFDEISDEIIQAVDYVVRWRQDDLSKASASNIIKINNNGEFKIIR